MSFIKTKTISCILLLTVSCIMISSCRKTEVAPKTTTIGTLNQKHLRKVSLGKQLENPYTVENMQKAFKDLIRTGKLTPKEIKVRATHLYLRFLPKNAQQLEDLEKADLELYSYPLDYEIKKVGDIYQDPAIPEGLPTYQYAVIKVGDAIPSGATHEVLAQLYLPGEETLTIASDEISSALESLEDQALIRTNNMSEKEVYTVNQRRRRWNPSGQILVENPTSGTIRRGGKRYDGVPNVKARARRWFTVKTAQTDANGYFRISHRFKRDVNYSVKYTNNQAFIKPSTIGLGPALLNGPKRKGHWEYLSNKGSNTYLWGAIMRGVYDYHFVWAPRYRIGTPPNDLKIKACGSKECGFTTMLHKTGTTFTGLFGKWLFSDVRIGSKTSDYTEIYSTTIHELGHAAHWKLSGDWNVTKNWKMMWAHQYMREAWATGITDVVYEQKFGRRYYWGSCVNNESLRLPDMKDDGYPRILVRDLMDNVNQYNASDANCDDLVDNVDGFTLSQVFYALRGAHGSSTNNAMEKWRDNLIARRPSERNDLNAYFKHWEK